MSRATAVSCPTRRDVACGGALALAFATPSDAGSEAPPPDGYTRRDETFPVRLKPDDPKTKPVQVTKPVLVSRNEGPAVIVMHEVFGLTPEVMTFCGRLTDAGFRVYAPVLFGPATPGRSNTAFIGPCVRGEIAAFRSGRSSPIVDWLKPLAARAAAECAAWGDGAGVIGLCLTGDFALAMAVEPAVRAPVMGEPSLPFRLLGQKDGLHISPAELAEIRRRHGAEGLTVKGYRFEQDGISRKAKFDRLEDELGGAFQRYPGPGRDIPGDLGARGDKSHSVFTLDFVQARMQGVLDDLTGFLHARLDRT